MEGCSYFEGCQSNGRKTRLLNWENPGNNIPRSTVGVTRFKPVSYLAKAGLPALRPDREPVHAIRATPFYLKIEKSNIAKMSKLTLLTWKIYW
jgi:hypothetical protein